MSEPPAEVRLVCCPKCENLLPEVTDYSVYQCGGCGAVLRAKNKRVESDAFSEKSDEGGLDKFSEKSANFDLPERRMMNMGDGSEIDVKSTGSSSSRAVEFKNGSIVEDDLGMNKIVEDIGISTIAQESENLKLRTGNSNGSRRSVRTFKGWVGENTQNVDLEGFKNLKLKDSEEAPSNARFGSGHEYAELVQNMDEDPVEDEYVEDDRAELLRKLDELKDQITRSRKLADHKPKEKFPLDRRLDHQDPYHGGEKWLPDGPSRIRVQYPIPDNLSRPPPFISTYPEPSPFTNSHEMPMHSRYPALHAPNEVQGFNDPFRPQILRRAPQQAPSPYEQNPYHPYFSGQYVSNDVVGMDLLEPNPHGRNLHHSSCSCLICYGKHQQVLPPIAPSNDRFSDVPNHHSMFYHHEVAQRDYNPRFPNYPLMNSRYPNSNTSRPDDLNSEASGFVRNHRPQRVLVTTGGRRCRPISGGAPFVTCCNCSELLQMPKKVLSMGRASKKMRCAACSEVIVCSVHNKKLVLSGYSEAKENSKKVDERSNVARNEGSLKIHGQSKWASTEFSSSDYDNSGYDFQSMDEGLVPSQKGPSLSSYKSPVMRSIHSTSSCTSEDENALDSMIAVREEAKSADDAVKAKPSPPLSGSPLQDHFDYSSKYNRAGKGNRSERSEIESVMPKKVATRQNSMKDAAVATEMEISSNEYSINTGTSQESGEPSREDDPMRVNKGGESFFAGIIKKSFRDFSRSSQNIEQGKINCIVNGHAITDRLVKKAEKLAGPIQPGEYWYDSRAGFWGVIGGPCRGIIPPFIEEFNYPMPENCAGGNTGVFVNGRELHPKDLDLLGSRGLPTERDRSYIIEISGRLLDEDSGEELESLGKLAPTVEKAKHGFGMKGPKAAVK